MYTKPMNLDRKIVQDIPIHQNALENPNVFGVEVELEGRGVKTAKVNVMNFWDVHNDGSLRVNRPEAEAIEYVFKAPLDMENTIFALENLFAHLNSPAVEVFDSYRTSIHVHLSCALESHRTIYNLMTLAIIFDELFVSQHGQHRIGNNFCLRSKDAQGQLTELIHSIEQAGNFYHVSGQNRYSSINFVSLMKFGTIEFRSLECTTDLKRVLDWVGVLDRLRRQARTYENPRDVIGAYSRMDYKEFMYAVLGEYAARYEKVEGWDRMLHNGMRLAQDLAYCSKWINRVDQVEVNKIKKAVKKPIPPGLQAAIQQMEAMNANGLPAPVPMPVNFWNAPPVFVQPAVEAVIEEEVDEFFDLMDEE